MRIFASSPDSMRTPATFTVLSAVAILIFQLALSGSAGSAAKPAPSARPIATPANVEATPQQQEALLSTLAAAVDWYQRTAIEQQLVTEPAETLYVTDNRQIANEAIDLIFQYARAEAALLAAAAQSASNQRAQPTAGAAKSLAPSSTNSPGAGPVSDLGTVTARLSQIQAEQAATRAKIDALKARLANARGRQRDIINSQLVSAQEEMELEQARIDSINEMIEFEKTAEKTRVSSGLMAQIDELQQSLPRRTQQPSSAAAQTPGTDRPAVSTGILQLAEALLELHNKDQALSSISERTTALNERIASLRLPLLKSLKASDQRGMQLSTNAGFGDLASAEQRRHAFAELLKDRKLTVQALLPLAKTSVDLNLYKNNLEHWRQALDRRWHETLRTLSFHLIVLGGLVGLIALGALVWRQLTFRYIQDARHRHRVLQIRTLTVIVLMVLVLLFNFSSEIGALATVMGLATAGIAFALQNVILSVAGYFFLSGRYGVRVGDRIQVAGVYGTVIDIGLVKLTLMELTGEGNFRQPTGRVVVFANSIVFQTNGNFFKQAPGISFVWSELRLTLAPDCDLQLAEKLLMDAVNDVVSRYREDLRREYRQSSQLHNVWFEPPEPHSNILLGADGIRISIRYPVQARRAVEINDELSRRLLNVINHEPRLRLVSSGTPTIQGVPISGDGAAAGAKAPPSPEAPQESAKR
jgi:small-conductance mechanosensitive channel